MPDDVRTLSQKPGTKLGHSTAKHPVMVEGRRDFFTYRDLAVKDASGGQMRAQLTKAKTGMTQPTGWHYHLCDNQFVYVLNGWVELEFETGEMLRLGAGDGCALLRVQLRLERRPRGGRLGLRRGDARQIEDELLQ